MSRVQRLRGLVARYRVDRRLPPSVLRLYFDVVRLRSRRFVDATLAALRPVTGRSRKGDVVRQRRRRFRSAGPLNLTCNDSAHRHASVLVDTLAKSSIDVFLVERREGSLVFGTTLDERARALSALADLARSDGWYLDWEDGGRTGTVPLGSAMSARGVRLARQWSLYQVRSWGREAIGREQAAVLTFWHLGTSGQLELVGTRGQERFEATSAPTTELIEGREYPGRAAFPVSIGLEHMADPIDVVYTWVDGSCPGWKASFDATSAEFGRDPATDSALDAGRFRSRDELRYSMRSVWAFCGWARRIFIVTAGQVPEWLVDDPRVRVVDHAEILPREALPTFNSHAIESAIHHIEGLAEHFVYFNDDVLLGRPVRPETFFTASGLPLVFHSDARVRSIEGDDTLAVDTAARRERELLAGRFGRVSTYKPLHSPHPLRRSIMSEIEIEFGDEVARTAHSRFRSSSDISIASSLAGHYALASGRAVLGSIASEYVHVESGRLRWHLDRILLGREFDTFCVNETEHESNGADRRERMISEFFESYLPVPAPWEAGTWSRDD